MEPADVRGQDNIGARDLRGDPAVLRPEGDDGAIIDRPGDTGGFRHDAATRSEQRRVQQAEAPGQRPAMVQQPQHAARRQIEHHVRGWEREAVLQPRVAQLGVTGVQEVVDIRVALQDAAVGAVGCQHGHARGVMQHTVGADRRGARHEVAQVVLTTEDEQDAVARWRSRRGL